MTRFLPLYRQKLALIFLALLAGLLAVRATSAEQGGAEAGHAVLPNPWSTNWEEARARARQENKPLVAMFSAVWCPPCQQMKREVLPDAAVQAELSKFVAVYIDEAQNRELLETQHIEAFPTFVFYAADGTESQRVRGGQERGDFIQTLQDARAVLTELPALREQIKAHPTDARLLIKLGDLLTRANDEEGSLKAYQAAAKLDPENKTGVHANLALARALKLAQSSPSKGDEALEQIIATWPTHPSAAEALFYRALLALNQQKKIEGVKLLDRYLQDYPKGRDASKVKQIRESIGRAN